MIAITTNCIPCFFQACKTLAAVHRIFHFSFSITNYAFQTESIFPRTFFAGIRLVKFSKAAINVNHICFIIHSGYGITILSRFTWSTVVIIIIVIADYRLSCCPLNRFISYVISFNIYHKDAIPCV